MADSSTLNHAARVLSSIAQERIPADLALRRYMVSARRLGPREKRAVSLAVFTYFRWLNWLDEGTSAQKAVEQALQLQTRFDQNPHAIKTEALAARAVPEWLRTEVELPAETLRQFQREPSLWLRARPQRVLSVLKGLKDCQPPPVALAKRFGLCPAETTASSAAAIPPARQLTALHYRGQQDLFLTPGFHAGDFEIQDLASQLVGHACAPKPGETWWDACAGDGGKLLHLADQMENKGLIWATDRSERRLQNLKRRAARAKVFNFRSALWEGPTPLPTKTKFDGVLLDAPCSGAGTWQRNPHARWTVGIEDVQELAAVQRALLDAVATSLKPGGRLVYSVCTLTRSETRDVARAFTAAHPDFEPTAVFPGTVDAASSLSSPACAVGETDLFVESEVTLWPHEINANGMYLAAWRKK